jgi:hypothetical protein
MFDQNLVVGLVVLGLLALVVYSNWPTMKRMVGMEGFANHDKKGPNAPGKPLTNMDNMLENRNGGMGANMAASEGKEAHANPHAQPIVPAAATGAEGFSDYEATMGAVPMGAKKPAGCYPRELLNPTDLLPSDPNSQWAQVNPTGAGDIMGKNFLSAGALIGVNTIGQSLRNANLQLRAEPPCPQVQVSPWLQSTIEPDLSRKPLDY